MNSLTFFIKSSINRKSTLGSKLFDHTEDAEPRSFLFLGGYLIKTAILVDGAFFLKRYSALYSNGKTHSAEDVANNLYTLCLSHLQDDAKKFEREHLYRILYYDCAPLNYKIHNPVSKQLIDFSKSREALFRAALFEELKKKRKVALRLGVLKSKSSSPWKISPEKIKDLLNAKIQIKDLTEFDVSLDIVQKGVDMKVGVDIASLAFKKLVDKIVLISGDGDFVPAAKLARREGIDFVLDPLWNSISSELHEHIDGLRSTVARPKPKLNGN
jgi:uncharacterized LabA/DUF88 family protein